MPLSEFFADQFRQIRAFMVDPKHVVRVLRVDPDLQPMLLKALAKMDDEADNVHAMLHADASFVSPEQYFAALHDQLEAEHTEHAAALEESGVGEIPYFDPAKHHPATRFCLYAAALAEALPDDAGSLVFLVDPESVHDAGAYRHSIDYLARAVDSRWLKFLVLEPRSDERLVGLEDEHDNVGTQTFYMPPDAIERKLEEQAAQPETADPVQHRRTLGVLAGFAFGRKDYGEAARMQYEWASLAEEDGAPAEAASAYYNLGNTMLESGELPHAEAYFLRCCNLCLEEGVDGVLPLALTNLGVTLFRLNRVEESLQTLEVAYQNFKAQKHRPGEAFVFDTLGSVYYEQQRHDEAEQAWLAAFDLYDGITSEPFADLRESGREDIRSKLERFYEATGRPSRLDERVPPAQGA